MRDAAVLLFSFEGEVPALISSDGVTFATSPDFKGFSGLERGLHVLRLGAELGSHPFYFFIEGAVTLLRVSDLPSVVGAEDTSYIEHFNALECGSLSAHLLPFPASLAKSWKNATSKVSIGVASETLPEHPKVQYNFPFIETALKGLCRGITPSEVTALGTDRSAVLRRYLRDCECGGFEGMLGRMQLAFLCFHMDSSFEAWRFWQEATFLIAHSHSYCQEKPQHLKDFLANILIWLHALPRDFFYAELTRDNFIAPIMRNIVEEHAQNKSVEDLVGKISRMLKKKFGFECGNVINDEKWGLIPNALSDESPSIVDLNEQLIYFD